ncbi:MAG: PilZ domain-containing protein [Desulfobacterales bacterium]|nr:PilZ domain-containing protein [Desulfobacterales bacterium]
MTFKGRAVTILDISAGGLACTDKGFKKYDIDRVTLNLKVPNQDEKSVLKAEVRILHLTRDDKCHCIFENCTVDEYEIIHKYVLEMQKQDLKRQAP